MLSSTINPNKNNIATLLKQEDVKIYKLSDRKNDCSVLPSPSERNIHPGGPDFMLRIKSVTSLKKEVKPFSKNLSLHKHINHLVYKCVIGNM